MTGQFIAVADVADLAEDGQQMLVEARGRRVLLCRSDGQYFAIENRCTHDHEQLLGGRVRKCTITCPIHGARFSLKNGRPFGPPAFEPITTFPLRVIGETIEIELPEN